MDTQIQVTTDVVTITSTTAPSDYVDSQQQIIDTYQSQIDMANEIIAQQQQNISDMQTLIATAQANIDVVVKVVPTAATIVSDEQAQLVLSQ